jgi:hypothetical protein
MVKTKQATLVLILTLALIFASCDRLKRKGHQVIDKTKETIKDKRDVIADKIISRFDAGTPDTRFNKQRFYEFFGFYPTSDIKNLYCHSDQLGIDASYYFGFECSDNTIQKIRKDMELIPDTTNMTFSGGLNTTPTSWWDTDFIKKNRPFSKQRENLYWYLWYDKTKNKAYFLTFDI